MEIPIRSYIFTLSLALLLSSSSAAAAAATPLNCSDATRLCTLFLAVKLTPALTLPLLESMFDVFRPDLTVDSSAGPAYVFVRKNCSCFGSPPTRTYLTNTTLTVREESTAYDAVAAAYGPLAVFPHLVPDGEEGGVVPLRLLCGCSSGLWNYLVSYVVEEGDSVEVLASRFGVSMDNIEGANGVSFPRDVVVGDVVYIPVDSVPGEPFTLKSEVLPPPPPASAPVSPPLDLFVKEEPHNKVRISYGWFVGGIGAALILIAICLLVCLWLKPTVCSPQGSHDLSKEIDGDSLHKFQILRGTNFCYGSGRYLCCKSQKQKLVTRDPDNEIDIPIGIVGDAFDMEKPIIFSYEEILSSTNGFSDANLLGHGTYGSVYYGVCREQEVAVKRMTALKNKEFRAEMKILCKVHHASLVELIGYAASEDELFVVYEYAQKGSLKSHLHDPQNKGHTPISWNSRVQIAVDAAKGLEYLHEHTRTHYVHRDIKTSNILLDSAFRAKMSDFGLAKLISETSDGEITATKVVGTFGYLAPEYLRDGLATTRSDVYAFGVVLFELISGKEAITRTEGMILTNIERRSLASVAVLGPYRDPFKHSNGSCIMLGALKNSPSSTNMGSLKECVDPNMMNLYPHDCVFKMAMLAKQCVDEDPILRPDMKQVVITLSHILLSSVEWEATLAGNSQVFSGLVQGR